jgi:hypothetical protein
MHSANDVKSNPKPDPNPNPNPFKDVIYEHPKHSV